MRLRTDTVWVHDSVMPDLVGGVRLMSLIPARLLGGRVLYFNGVPDPGVFLDRHRPDCLILNKPMESDALPLLAETARRRQIRVVTIVTDWYFGDDAVSLRYRRMIKASDDVVVQTQPMAEYVQVHHGVTPTVIEEPLEYPRMPPRFVPGKQASLLWFMSAGNYDTIRSGLMELDGIDTEIILLCSSVDQVRRHLPANLPDTVTLQIIRWSLGVQFDLMQQANLIFVPSVDDQRKHVKGHNRVTEAINAGRLAVAYPLRQYQELEDYCILDEHPGRGIRTALGATDNLSRLVTGQDYIARRFAPEIVAEKWRLLIDDRLSPGDLVPE